MLTVFGAASAADVIGWVAAIVSILLACFAIWQATVFFRWSNTAQSSAAESAREIQASVVKLEALFDRLYADTFGMMRDTVADLRKHVWYAPTRPSPREDGDGADDRIEALRAELRAEVADLGSQINAASTQVEAVESRVEGLIDRAIAGSTEAIREPRNDDLETRLTGLFLQADGSQQASTLESLVKALGTNADQFIDFLFDWRRDGTITWPGPSNQLSLATPMTLTDEGRERLLARSLG